MINSVAGVEFSNTAASNIERIDVLKGPSAILSGSSLNSLGGAINVTLKQPKIGFSGQAGVTGGSWGLQRVTADVNTPLNDNQTALFRINSSYHYQNTWQDFGFNRITLAPSFSYKVNERLSFLIETQYSHIDAAIPLWFYATARQQV